MTAAAYQKAGSEQKAPIKRAAFWTPDSVGDLRHLLASARRRKDDEFANDISALLEIEWARHECTPEEEAEIALWPVGRLVFSSRWLWRYSQGYALAEACHRRTGDRVFDDLARDYLGGLNALRCDTEAHWRVRRQAHDVYERGRRIFPDTWLEALEAL